MITREEGLQEIFERVKLNRTTLGLKAFKRTPTEPINDNQMPCIFMHEGIDKVVEHSSRHKVSYPVKRVMIVTLELVTNKSTDIKELYRNVRRIVFTQRGTDPPITNPVIANQTFISENRTEGPTGYGLPDVLGMSLVLDMFYIDNGF